MEGTPPMSSSQNETGVELINIIANGVMLKTSPRGWVSTARACDQKICSLPPSFWNLIHFNQFNACQAPRVCKYLFKTLFNMYIKMNVSNTVFPSDINSKKTFYKIRVYLTIGIWIALKEFYNSGFVWTYYDSALNRECQDMTTSLINISQICFKIGQKVIASMPPMLNLVKFFSIYDRLKLHQSFISVLNFSKIDFGWGVISPRLTRGLQCSSFPYIC